MKENFSTTIEKELKTKIKVFCARNDFNVNDIIEFSFNNILDMDEKEQNVLIVKIREFKKK